MNGAKVVPINQAPLSPAKRAAIIDEFGDLSRQLAEMDPVAKRHKVLKEQIAGWYDDEPAELGFAAGGMRYAVTISPRPLKRSIFDMTALKKLLGLNRFLQLCSFSLEKIDENVPSHRHKDFLHEARSGARTVKAVQKLELPKAS